MRKALLIMLIICTWLSAAEIRDGSLYLEVNLHTASSMDLPEGEYSFCDASGLFCQDLQGKLSISILKDSHESRFGIVERIEETELSECEDAQNKVYFDWEGAYLVIKQENRYFFPQSFGTIEQAKAYALALGLPERRIEEIPIVNSSIVITDAAGEARYFESPVKIAADQLWIGDLCYEGEFILKEVDHQLVINQILPLEEYIAGVIPNEIGNNSPMQALKAQAVAARTHAVNLLLYNRHAKDGYDLCNSTHCQVYKGKHLRNSAIAEAVSETAAEIMVTGDRVVDSTYHSSCGGKTDSSQAIWNGAYLPQLSGSLCIPEASKYDLSTEAGAANWINTQVDTENMSSWERSALNWQRSIDRKELAQNLGLSSITSIRIVKRGESGRILELLINDTHRLQGEYKIRQAFNMLPSSFFYFANNPGKTLVHPGKRITIKGRGSGHGVGMCQVGALRKARAGSDYREILQTYYPQTKITTVWIHHENP